MMADDTRQLHDSIKQDDWRHVLRLCRKDKTIVHECTEKKELPLFMAFKHEAYESAGVLMKYGAQHPSCPDNVQKCKEYVADLVKGQLYEDDYDVIDPDSEN